MKLSERVALLERVIGQMHRPTCSCWPAIDNITDAQATFRPDGVVLCARCHAPFRVNTDARPGQVARKK